MKDKDFDDIFSKGLSGEQKQVYDDRLWDKLVERLDEHENKGGALLSSSNSTSMPKFLPWVGLMLLLLLGANTLFLFKMNQSDDGKTQLLKELNELKAIIEKQNNQPKLENTIKKDTIIIYKYLPTNTSGNRKKNINNSNISQKINSVENPYLRNENNGNTPSSNFNSEKLKGINSYQNQLNTSLQKSEVGNFLEKTTSFNDSSKTLTYEITPLLPTVKTLPHWYFKHTLMVLPQQSTDANIISPPQYKKRFWVGLNGGLINYHTSWLSKDNVSISRNEKSYQIGLKMEYALTNHWRIIAGGDFCPFTFKIFWQDNRYNLPALPSYFANYPNEYKLRYSKASQSLIQGYAGMKYVFSGNKWRPYLGVAYTQMEILPFDTEYSFLKVSTNKEIIQTVKQKQVSVSNIAMLNGGFEYKITSRLIAQGEGFYYKDINKVKKTYDLFGLRGSVLIGF